MIVRKKLKKTAKSKCEFHGEELLGPQASLRVTPCPPAPKPRKSLQGAGFYNLTCNQQIRNTKRKCLWSSAELTVLNSEMKVFQVWKIKNIK